MSWVVLVGSPLTGLAVYGTFPSQDKAAEWAEGEVEDWAEEGWEWWTVEVLKP